MNTAEQLKHYDFITIQDIKKMLAKPEVITCECGCTTDEHLPDPRDFKGEIRVCVDCEYRITESYQDLWSEEPTDYRSVTSGY